MAVEIRWTLSSLEDIETIAEFIAKDSPFYAQIQTERFFQRVRILESYPESGRTVPEVGQNEIRELIEGNYRIVYKIVSGSLIDIITVHHSSRILKSDRLLD